MNKLDVGGVGSAAAMTAISNAANGTPLPANVRAILRVTNEFFMRGIDTTSRMMGGDFIRGVVYTAIWTANIRHITNSPSNQTFGGMDDLPPDALRRPVSVLTIANGLRLPYETTRRYANELVARGICTRVGGGLVIPSDVFLLPQFRAAVVECYRNMQALVLDLTRVGFDFTPYRAQLSTTVRTPPGNELPPNLRALLRTGTEMQMRIFDTLTREHDGDTVRGVIYTAIWRANVRHITDAGTEYTDFDSIPDDACRKPVTVNEVSETLRIPYETVRRYANKLVADGMAVRFGNKGLMVPKAVHARDSAKDGVRETYLNLLRGVGDWHRAGFDFSAI